MSLKKTIPFVILKEIEHLGKKYSDISTLERKEDYLIFLSDKEKTSNFYFGVKSEKPEVKNSQLMVLISYNPANLNNLKANTAWVKPSAIGDLAEHWAKIVRQFNEAHDPYEDPILKYIEKDFETEYVLVDDDEFAPFNLQSLLFLDDYLATSEKKINAFIEASNDEEEIKELEELRTVAVAIRKNASKQPKQKVFKSLIKFWAKAQKIGVPVIRDIFINVAADFTKKLLGSGEGA